MRVLGIDPGSRTLGWAIIEGSGLKYRGIAYGTIKSDSKLPFGKRLARIYSGLAEIAEQFQPDVLSIEEAFYAKNVKVALKLGQVRGVVLLLGENLGYEIVEYSPRLVKKTVVGYGNADKIQIQEMVRILLKLDVRPEPDDAADALAIAICHFHHVGIDKRVRTAQKK